MVSPGQASAFLTNAILSLTPSSGTSFTTSNLISTYGSLTVQCCQQHSAWHSTHYCGSVNTWHCLIKYLGHNYTQLSVTFQWHSQHFTLFLKPSKTDQQDRGTTIKSCKLTESTCLYHSMATYIALASHKDPYTTPLFCFSNGHQTQAS